MTWLTSWPSAQSPVLHLNPVIEKLSQGKPFVGVSTGDLSLENARTLSRAPIDYVYVDMEHTPLNIDGLHMFNMGMTDKALILKKGNCSRTWRCSRGFRRKRTKPPGS